MGRWWERQRGILDVALASLARRPGKHLSLLAVYAAIVFLLASLTFLLGALRREAALVLSRGPDLTVQRMVAGRHEPIPADAAREVAGIRGVSAVRPRLWGYAYSPEAGATFTLMVPPRSGPAVGQAIPGSGAAAALGAVPGGTLSLPDWRGARRTFGVPWVLDDASALVTADLVLLSEVDFRSLLGYPDGLATDLEVTVPNARERDTAAGKVAAMIPGTRVVTRDDVLRTYESVFSWRGGLATALLAGALLAFIIFSWDRAAGLSAEERGEIAILKAVGWETSDVLLFKLWEGAAVSLTAFLAGTLLAYAHVFLGSAFLFAPVIQGWSVLYPPLRPVPFAGPFELATLFALTVLPYTAATLVPSWRAATVDPDSVLRS